MKKIIIGFILLGVMAYGVTPLGNDTVENQKIIDNLKVENQNLSKEIDELNSILDKLENSFSKDTNLPKLGVYMTRTRHTFTVKIQSNDLSSKVYEELLDNLSYSIQYKETMVATITGNQKNIDFLKNYFESKGIDKTQLEFKVLDSDVEAKEDRVPTTTILLKENKVS